MATSPHDTSAHHRPGGNNPNGNPNWVKGQRTPYGNYWQPGHSGNPNTPTISPEVFERFIAYLTDAHTVTWAAQELGVSHETFYDHRNHDLAFAAAWDYARNVGRADWYEERLRGRASGEEKGDTLSDIIGVKMTGRFVEPQYQQKLAVNVNVNLPFADYTPDQLRALLAKLDAQAPTVEGQVVEVKALPEAGAQGSDTNLGGV